MRSFLFVVLISSQRLPNRFERTLQVRQNIVVREPQDPEPLARKPGAATLIIRALLGVLPAVQFHNQAAPMANEVQEYRLLRVPGDET